MNVANLELCRELYALSGLGWDKAADKPDVLGVQQWYSDEHTLEFMVNWREERFKPWVPAYSLGYLLRKLPQTAVVSMQDGNGNVNGYYADSYKLLDRKQEPKRFEADTPEDAACKLLIKLIQEGVVKV